MDKFVKITLKEEKTYSIETSDKLHVHEAIGLLRYAQRKIEFKTLTNEAKDKDKKGKHFFISYGAWFTINMLQEKDGKYILDKKEYTEDELIDYYFENIYNKK